MKTVALGGATLLMLSAAQAALPGFFRFLPLGGSPIAETGIVLGVSVAIAIAIDLLPKKQR